MSEPDKPQEEKLEIPIIKDGSLQTKELIRKHLLGVRYHVFQQIDVNVSRASSDEKFSEPMVDHDRTHRFDSQHSQPPFIDHLRASKKIVEVWDYIPPRYSDYVNGRRFTTSKGESVHLGMVALVRIPLKTGFGILINGAFSTESNPRNDRSKRRGGRSNSDNQIMFKFNSEEAANNFYESFDDNPYKKNPEGVEKNTKIIEDSMKTVLDQESYRSLESCLFLGLEVKKF